jgi:hypothetical protein
MLIILKHYYSVTDSFSEELKKRVALSYAFVYVTMETAVANLNIQFHDVPVTERIKRIETTAGFQD